MRPWPSALPVGLGIAVLWYGPATAHAAVRRGWWLSSGFEHPIGGLDHVLAMVSVGIWGAQLGAPALWLLPVTFPVVMALGGFLGLIGMPLPGVEVGIALSALGLGAAILLQWRPPVSQQPSSSFPPSPSSMAMRTVPSCCWARAVCSQHRLRGRRRAACTCWASRRGSRIAGGGASARCRVPVRPWPLAGCSFSGMPSHERSC